MQDEDKSKDYLINELNDLRQQVAELEAVVEQYKLGRVQLDQQVHKLQIVGPGSRLAQEVASDLNYFLMAIDNHCEFLLGCSFNEEESCIIYWRSRRSANKHLRSTDSF